VYTTKRPQEVTQPRACPLAGVAMYLPHPIAIIVPRPLPRTLLIGTVADRGVRDGQLALDAPVATPVVGLEDRRATRHPAFNHPQTVIAVSVLADGQPHAPGLTGHQGKDRRAIIGIGPVSAALIGTPPRRIVGVKMWGAFFPPRSDTTRRLQRSSPEVNLWAAPQRGSLAPVGAGWWLASVRVSVPVPAGPSTHLWRSRARAAPGSQASAGFWQRSSHPRSV
jgi:hypothetical protein